MDLDGDFLYAAGGTDGGGGRFDMLGKRGGSDDWGTAEGAIVGGCDEGLVFNMASGGGGRGTSE